jgi:hypothetical protein
MKLHIYPTLAYQLIRKLGKSLTMEVIGAENIEEAHKRGGPVIFVFWHGSQFFPAWWCSGRDITILSSASVDGRMQAKILTRLGYDIVTGSSSRGAVGALKNMVKTLKQGRDVAIAVDGPRGPYHEVKPGLGWLAEKTGASIVPLVSAYNNCRQFSAWDKYQLPKFFSSGVFIVGRPFKSEDFQHPEALHIYVEKTLDQLNEEAVRLLEEKK